MAMLFISLGFYALIFLFLAIMYGFFLSDGDEKVTIGDLCIIIFWPVLAMQVLMRIDSPFGKKVDEYGEYVVVFFMAGFWIPLIIFFVLLINGAV